MIAGAPIGVSPLAGITVLGSDEGGGLPPVVAGFAMPRGRPMLRPGDDRPLRPRRP